MEENILLSTKKVLGVGADDESFDLDIITFINSAFSTINQVGVGPADFTLETGDEVWDDFLEPGRILNQVKTFVLLATRMMFDPPQTSYLIGAFEKQLTELLWRINVMVEETDWVDPDPPLVVIEDE